MSQLDVYADDFPDRPLARLAEAAQIREALAVIGVDFERWETKPALGAGADEATVLGAYHTEVEALKARHGFQSADVISLHPDHPDKDTLRAKFLEEHTHDDFEVRFFVEGQGLFCIHADGRVYAVRCEAGDLISVPAGTTHWFDMGPNPSFRCIRLYTTPAGWVAKFTGSDIAGRFPRLVN